MIKKNILTDLTILYSSPGRSYHNLNHIHYCLGKLEEYMHYNVVLLKRELEYAIWFHDAIYNVYSKNNELASAQLFIQYAQEQDLSLNDSLVYELIIKTVTHNIDETGYFAFEHNLMSDIELSILGSEPHSYEAYKRGIREEYNFALYPDFTKAREIFLRSFLARNKIFKTDYFHDKLEKQARKNLNKELEQYLNENK